MYLSPLERYHPSLKHPSFCDARDLRLGHWQTNHYQEYFKCYFQRPSEHASCLYQPSPDAPIEYSLLWLSQGRTLAA
jgi:hypothetical protein